MYKIITDKLKDNAEIWRYMDVTKFLSLLSKKELWLARADTFEDKWEGKFYPKIKEYIDSVYKSRKDSEEDLPDNGISNTKDFQEHVRRNSYISCWHKNADENMIMWKLYGQTEKSIAIKTTVAKLKESFNLNDIYRFSLEVALDDVVYAEPNEDVKLEKKWRQSFFLKRPHFAFEKEVRLYLKPKEEKFSTNAPLGYRIPVDLSKLIGEIYVHPDSQGWFFEIITDLVKKYDLTIEVKKGVCGNKL